jgi:Domain of unknown function (DUF4326)
MEHHCHARGCESIVKPELLMCWYHWKQVPKNVQQAVWATYRPGQCDDKHPSQEWHQAADAAIGYIARKEGHKLRPVEEKALANFEPAIKIPRVVHCKNENFDIYVGRPSKFGNPYTHKEGTEAPWVVDTREDAIRLYEEWLLAQPELVAAAKKELKGKTLACWCKPLACHGDVLLRIANEEDLDSPPTDLVKPATS